ncbi:unnamed protein product [Notodromas monacha]|uniref:Double-strand-break repair protein rad21 homolog n=1 Tax=Notodromas monacha TaxID=399045 RepID=A0A7R9BSN8_9CRUS|nr:unnamed protein product [Notodromas monacha]CAG0919938.1 unnamed protein product [Notodromas monacha]
MFYAHFVLSKKGPLARIWLAAHWDKKLTKAHVFETNIEKSVEGILQPKVKLALRTSGHLLLGVVRIYSRKAKYLLADCNEAFVKIKMAFRPGMVDLPEESREAAVNAITLPEVFHDFDNDLNDLNDVDIQAQFALNQSRAEEITMREDFGNLQMSSQFDADDNFSGNVGLETSEASELLRDDHEVPDRDLNFPDPGFGAPQRSKSHLAALETSAPLELPETPARSIIDTPADDGFGGPIGADIMAGGLFEGGIFDDVPMDVSNPPEPLDDTLVAPEPQEEIQPQPEAVLPQDSDDDAYDDNFADAGPPSVGGSSRSESPAPVQPESVMPPPAPRQTRSAAAAAASSIIDTTAEQTTLIQNEDESFALAPVDASALKGWPRTKRKRKLIVDEVKNISGEEMKAQLADTADIVTTLDLAPPTKRLMHWKETGGVERLFTVSGRNIPGKEMFRIYSRHLISHEMENEELPDGPMDDDVLQLDAAEEAPEEQVWKKKSNEVEEEEHHEEDKENIVENAGMRRSERKTRKRKAISMAEDEEDKDEQLHQQLEHEHLQPPAPPLEQEIPNDLEQQLEAMHAPSIPKESTLLAEPSLISPPVMSSSVNADADLSRLDSVQPEMANMGWDGPEIPQEPVHAPLSPFSVRGPFAMMTPGHDFDFPPSVAPSMGLGGLMDEPEDIQATDETYEEYEERVLNKRALQMHRIFKTKFDELEMDTLDAPGEKSLQFHSMIVSNNRKQVSQKFYTLLVLKKAKAIELDQDESFGPLKITKGPDFLTCKL